MTLGKVGVYGGKDREIYDKNRFIEGKDRAKAILGEIMGSLGSRDSKEIWVWYLENTRLL